MWGPRTLHLQQVTRDLTVGQLQLSTRGTAHCHSPLWLTSRQRARLRRRRIPAGLLLTEASQLCLHSDESFSTDGFLDHSRCTSGRVYAPSCHPHSARPLQGGMGMQTTGVLARTSALEGKPPASPQQSCINVHTLLLLLTKVQDFKWQHQVYSA